MFSIPITGEEFTIDVEESCTIFELKEAIDEEIGVGPRRQALFLLGYPLTEDAAQLKDFPQTYKTFNVVLPKEGGERDRTLKGPREVVTDKEVFLITGGRLNFQAILLHADQEEWIKLKSKKFGVVKHIEGDEIGKRIFHFRVYEVKNEGRIDLRTENGLEKVYLVI